MGKLILIIGLTACFNTDIYSQLTAMFETAFYFEDGVGNKDTVYLKQDPSIESYSVCANCENITLQEEYGEDYLTSPFDSVFEVRAGHVSDYNQSYDLLTEPNTYKFQKTVVMSTSTDAPYYPDCHYLGRGLVFMIRIKNLPLKVTYDAEFFDKPCNAFNYFSNTYYFFQAAECEPEEIINCFQNSPESEFFACMDTGYFEYSFDRKYGEQVLGAIDEMALINDGTVDTLEFLQIEFGFQPLTPCYDVLLSANEAEEMSDHQHLQIYPNPANTEVIFDTSFSQEMSVSIFNTAGKLICSRTVAENESSLHIDTSNYPEGIYFYTAYDENNRKITSGKFIVAR